ncbi:hypothetical protein RclHR1_23640003 [Rhizophagus clarus]|uniref:Uncharacterized protein n=1 Tax=Rhizophagus clarus TaxID=94130 RepID=A0A2Z6QW01_9GLOM|nr:hypothetical protein RclHR1_23640003 [Rhizophagus clarus]
MSDTNSPASSYTTVASVGDDLSEGIENNDVRPTLIFIPELLNIDDKDEELENCIKELKRRMSILGSVTGSNEALHHEYASLILYSAIYIARKLTKKEITVDPQFKVLGEGEEAVVQVSYTIKKAIDTGNKFIMFMAGGKQEDFEKEIVQNVMQPDNSCENKGKRKATVAFDEFDYLYGIVTTGRNFSLNQEIC